MWEMDIDSAGDITFTSMTIAAVSVSVYTVQLQVSPALSSGILDASKGGTNTVMTLRMRVKVTGNSVGSQCQTSYVDVPVEGNYNYYPNMPPTDPWGVLAMYTGNDGDLSQGEWIAMPAMPANGCMGQEGTINALLGLGAGGGLGTFAIDRLVAKAYFGPYGS
jgi:hypothetical protein